MILSKEKILEEIKNKKIVITKTEIDDTTIKLHLGNEFRIFKEGIKQIVLTENQDCKKFTKVVKKKEYLLQPGEFILGVTKETIKLPNNVAGLLTGRSRFARLGLSVHSTSNYVHPGVNNKQVLVIKNNLNRPIVLKEGMGICQLILFGVEGKAGYKGKFWRQSHV